MTRTMKQRANSEAASFAMGLINYRQDTQGRQRRLKNIHILFVFKC